MKRASRACDACARRKIRCDRHRPCQSCLQRNMGRYCSNYVSDATTSSESSNQTSSVEVALLKEKLASLEEQLAQTQYPLVGSGPSPLPMHDINHSVSSQQYPLPNLDTLQSAIEDLNLGIDKNQDVSTLEPVDALSFELHLSPLLPSHKTSKQIVQFSLQNLGWIHCALRSSIFLQEHESFWASVQAQQIWHADEASWLALYFAVLSTGLYYMDTDNKCFDDFSFYDPNFNTYRPSQATEAENISRLWYKASLSELEKADFMGKARLRTIQTIAILTLVNKSFGENEREWIMMGSTINMARSLSMHLLDSQETYKPTNPKASQWTDPQDRALGRRLWWTLVICDWLGSMNEPPTIQPDSFNSRLEPYAFVQDVVSSNISIDDPNSTGISCLTYHEIIGNLAQVLRTYVKAGRDVSKINLALAMAEVERISSELPSHLRPDEVGSASTAYRDSHCPWIPMQRYLLTHVLQFVRLTIARSSFDQWFNRQPDREGFHQKAIEAADTIVSEKSRGLSPMYQKSWIICASTVAAGVFMGLDLLCFSTGEDQVRGKQRRNAIQICINSLEALGSTNIISRRGPIVLKKLLALDAKWDYRSVPTREKLHDVVKHISVIADNESQLNSHLTGQETATATSAHMTGLSELEAPALDHENGDVFDSILANGVFDDVEFEMETFENPFDIR